MGDVVSDLNDAIRDITVPSRPHAAETRPICVVGLPRSGTTLATQLMVSGLDVGWISNIAARFWTNPAVGASLQQQLQAETFTSTMHSALGQTAGPLEPHEFGKFWLDGFGQSVLSLDPADRPSELDLRPLAQQLNEVSTVFARPVVYKSFLVPLAIRELLELLPHLLIVRVHRPIEDVIVSLVNAHRREGETRAWIGVRPADWRTVENLPLIERVSHQCLSVSDFYDDAMSGIDTHNLIDVDYETLATEPYLFVDEVISRGIARRPVAPPAVAHLTTPHSSFDEDDRAEIRRILARTKL